MFYNFFNTIESNYNTELITRLLKYRIEDKDDLVEELKRTLNQNKLFPMAFHHKVSSSIHMPKEGLARERKVFDFLLGSDRPSKMMNIFKQNSVIS